MLEETSIFVPLAYQIEYQILDMIDDKSSKIEDIRSKLIAFDSIHLTLQVNSKNIYLTLKNNISLSKKPRVSCFKPSGHYILSMIDDNSLKTQDTLFKLRSFGRFRSALQVNIKNMLLSLKSHILFSK